MLDIAGDKRWYLNWWWVGVEESIDAQLVAEAMASVERG